MFNAIIEKHIAEIVKKEVGKQLNELKKTGILDPKDIPKIWARGSTIAKMFDKSRTQVYEDAKKMAKDPNFKEYVRQSTRMTEISVYGYDLYRKKLSDSYLR